VSNPYPPPPSNPYPAPPSWAHEIVTIAVTGTDGKTSTTRYCAAGLAAARLGPVARMTTVDAGIDDQLGPPPADHDGFLAMMRSLHERGGRRAAIEVTSAVLGLGFARAWPMRVGVFTNLGNDHMRTHGSAEHYLAAKAQLFLALPSGGAAVLNAGDPNAALIAEVLPTKVRALWFAGPGAAEDRDVDLRVRTIAPSWDGLALELEAREQLGSIPKRLRLRTSASFQASNAAAALLTCVALGVTGSDAAAGIEACSAPPGRFELVTVAGVVGPRVIVDYAHTPEALRAALASARALCEGRLIVVLGAGGESDRNKRPALGQAASAADEVLLTSDNPRGEDPATIADDVAAGLAAELPSSVELDRDRAIAQAITRAEPCDLVLIAGKGHERIQEIAGERRPFSDQDSARAALERRR
jgi:UDP-N-acetylmuramoyl-L-alanyl-D-glutamate--2,6-diaminopimelate ligase